MENKIFIEQAPHAIAMFDKEMRYISASRKWLEDYKLKDVEIKGRSHYEIFPEIGDDWKKIHKACLQGEINTCEEISFERADGSLQWITWDVRPWYLEGGEIGGLLMFTADLTDKKKEEFEKRRMEEILDKTSEIARVGAWDYDVRKNRVKWSEIIRKIHEVEEDYEPNMNTVLNFYKEGESRRNIVAAIDAALKYGTPYDLELQLTTAKGKEIWVRAIGQAEMRIGKCQRIYGVFQDINDAKQLEERLYKLNEELNMLLNAGHVSFIGTDTSGVITHFNKGAEILLQYTAMEGIGIHTPAKIHVEKEVQERGIELSAKYGRVISGFEVFVALSKHEGFESREWTYVRKDGSTFPVQLVVTAIKDLQGEITGYLGVATDISEMKKAAKELQTVIEITKDQNERLKNFAHIVSHNLRSHSGNIDMILDLFIYENPDAINNQYISHLKKSSENLKETISNLNEVVLMNTSPEMQFAPVNLYKVIQSAINNISQLVKESAVAVINNVRENEIIMGIPAYMDSVILNFITNGIKYRAPGRDGVLILSTHYSGNYLILTIEDNGIGIDLKKNGHKLFGMYKTFHGNADARGIGLFITKNQVLAMGGKIEVESEVNKGTKFKIYFKHEKN